MSSILGEQIEELLKEFVNEEISGHDFKEDVGNAVDDYDFTDIVKEAVRDEVDVDSAVEKAMNDFDFSDAINEAVRDYDWWDEIKNKATEEIESEVENQLDDKISEFMQGDVFKEAVRAALVKIGQDMLAEFKAAVAKRWAAFKVKVAGYCQRIKLWVTWPYRRLRG